MTALIVIGGILLFFALILCLRVTFVIEHRDELRLSLRVLFLRIPLHPRKEKRTPRRMSAKKAAAIRERIRQERLQKAEKMRQKAAEKARKKAEKKASPEAKKASLEKILDTLTLIRGSLARATRLTLRYTHVRIVRLRITVATEDAAQTAIAYGAVTQAINVLIPLLEPLKGFSLPKPKDLDVVADFTGEQSSADLKFSFSLRIWQLIHIGTSAFFAAVTQLVKRKLRAAKKQAAKAKNAHKSSSPTPKA